MSDSASSSQKTTPVSPPEAGGGSARGDGAVPIPSSENQPTVITSRPPISASSRPSSAPIPDESARHVERMKPGTHLGDIELSEHIGGGGMGQVYRGEDLRLHRPVAVKVMSRHQAADSDAVRRFLNEARSAARLNHRNIAQVFSAGESEGRPFIVFEYVEGENIRAIVEQRGPLPLDEALSYTIQIADALAHAAEMRIVHRDVKPSNILITPRGFAKLIDLGLARLNEPNPREGDLTASGVTLGTFDYISPEQARDPRNADSRSDIYSLGCTFFFMLVGRPPFPEGTVLQKLLQHQGDEPPDIHQFRPDLPDEAAEVLAKMMAKDPRRRYPDSSCLMEGLLSLADVIGLQPTGAAQAVWLPPQESRVSALRRQMPWLAPATVLGCLVAMLHFLWSSQDQAADLAMQGFHSRGPVVEEAAGPRTVVASFPGEARKSVHAAGQSGRLNGAFVPGGQEPAEMVSEPAWDPLTGENAGGSAETGLAWSIQSLWTPRRFPFEGILKEDLPDTALGPEPLSARLGSSADFFGAMTLAGSTADSGGALNAGRTTPESSPPSLPGSEVGNETIVVTPVPQDRSQFVSVEAALAARPNATQIELRFNGRQFENPLTLSGRTLTLRAGAGYHPVIAFKPAGTDPILYPREMIRIEGGEVAMDGIALELDVPREIPAEAWSLVRFSPNSSVRMENCSLTIRNATENLRTYHPNVAFLRMGGSETPEAVSHGGPWAGSPTKIGMKNCVVRGEAVLLQFRGTRPIAFAWDNGLLATTEPVLLAGGGNRSPLPGSAVQLRWTRVTLATAKELIRLVVDEHRPYVAPLAVSESACVLSCPTGPLIHITGSLDPEPLVKQLRWEGRDSRVESSAVRLQIDPVGASSEDELIRLEALSAQASAAAGLPMGDSPIPWLQPALMPRAVHSAQIPDYEISMLNLVAPGPNRDAGTLPGFVASLLPVLPLDPIGR